MKLVTFGCSFIEGDCISPISDSTYKNKHNIGGVINSNYKFSNYINYGNNGASNERIILQILEYINSKNFDLDDFLVIGLSSLTRSLKYLNNSNTALTIPTWDYKTHIKDTNHGLNEFDGVEEWMNSVLDFEENNRNHLVRYLTNCLSIKSLIKNHKKVLVFQSLDSPNLIYQMADENMNWSEILMNINYGDLLEQKESDLFFNKNFICNVITSDLLQTQKWISFEDKSYNDYIAQDTKMRCRDGFHPSEYGARKYFEDVLKKYIDRII
jgi:hypothetical protein